MDESPEASELAELPATSPLKHLCNESIDLIRRLDPFIAHLANEKGFAELRILISRGEPTKLKVIRDFRINEAF